MHPAFLVVTLVVGCGKGKEKAEPIMVSDAAEAGKKDIAQVSEALAAKDAKRAGKICAVAAPGMGNLKKADAALATQLDKLCNRDVAVMDMAAAIDKIEANKKPDVTGLHLDCTSRAGYEKFIAKGGYQADPEIVALEARWEAACPTKKP